MPEDAAAKSGREQNHDLRKTKKERGSKKWKATNSLLHGMG